jgi:hypothetical protein
MFLLIYVDDIIVASSSDLATDALLNDLWSDFALKDLLPWNWGYIVSRGYRVVSGKIHQGYSGACWSTKLQTDEHSLASDEKLSLTDGTLLSPDDATSYRSVVGAL